MNRRNEWENLLKTANEDLKADGIRISIDDDEEEGYFRCIIYKGNRKIETYAENYYEDELDELVNDVWSYAKGLVNKGNGKKGIWDAVEENGWKQYDDFVSLIKDTLAPNNPQDNEKAYEIEDEVNAYLAKMFKELEEKYL